MPSIRQGAHTDRCADQVWRARCKQTGEIVAIKVMDLENVNCSLVRCFFSALHRLVDAKHCQLEDGPATQCCQTADSCEVSVS